MANINLEQARLFATDSGISFNADNLVEAVRIYNMRDDKTNITNPQRYFIPILKELTTGNHEKNINQTENKTGTTRHYPFTDQFGITWHSFDYAVKNDRWWKKHLEENRHGGFDVIMMPCEKPHFPGPEEAELNLQNDKNDGIYQAEAQKFFNLAKSITEKLPLLPTSEGPTEAEILESFPEEVPWE
jgi:hypothetical protein